MAADDESETEIWTPNDEGQLSKEDALTDRGLDDDLDEGYSPPERPLGLNKWGTTAAEEAQGEPLDLRLAEEEPDVSYDPDAPRDRDDSDEGDETGESDEFFDSGQVGAQRAGRLYAPDEGIGDDEEKDEVGFDAGIDGGGASAEEAAMHIVE